MNVPSTDDAVPTGWDPDFHAPTHFVVRCTHCGRLDINTDRVRAIKRADNHGLHCSPTGVTPVRKPSDAQLEAEFTATDAGQPAISDGGLDARETDLVGERVQIKYESVAKRAGEQQQRGAVTAMIRATSADEATYQGFIVRLPDERRRRVDLLKRVVQCPHNQAPGWRKIGDLRGLEPGEWGEPAGVTDGPLGAGGA